MRTGALLTAWVALTLAGFWIYDGRYRLPVEGRVATNPHEATALAVPGAKATLLAFYTPGCGCSRFAESHIASLARRFSPRGLRIVTVVEGRGEAPRFDGLVQDPNGRLARALGVSAAPGAVVLDAKGRTAYVGGFNVARFCDDARSAYAEQAVVAVLAGRRPARPRGPFYGCATVAAG